MTGYSWKLPACVVVLVFGVGLLGCSRNYKKEMASGQFGVARADLQRHLTTNKQSRSYMIDRMKLAIFDIADGNTKSPEPIVSDTYEFLRTQGINEDKTVAAVVLNEGVKRWKGEPFEQAMMFSYIAVYQAMCGSWDNARAAAINSLFLLHDFGTNPEGNRKSTLEIAKEKGDLLTYEVIPSNFALGYILAGAANIALSYHDPDRDDEAKEHFSKAIAINLGLSDLVRELEARTYNTLLVVTYGAGPTKIAYGPDRACAAFSQINGWTGTESLTVAVNNGESRQFPIVTDLNMLAADHMWNNLEDVRLAKSRIGTAATGVGLGLMASGNRYAQLAGVCVALFGLFLKANAAADTTHCEILPQRVYVAPVLITEPNSSVTVNVGADEQSRMIFPGLSPPMPPQKVQLRLVCIPPSRIDIPWMRSGRVFYANDSCTVPVEGDGLPYILGGRCVKKPTEDTLAYYQSHGNLSGMTLNDLLELYRAEGIATDIEAEGGIAGLHILEGGQSMETPLAGTTGFVRLFCQEHGPYKPRSKELRAFIAGAAFGAGTRVQPQ